MNPFAWHWLVKSLLSLAFVIPAWLAIGFFEKNYGVRGQVTMIWYFLAAAMGNMLFVRILDPTTAIIPSTSVLLAILTVGLILGAGTNGLLFSALPDAPNQAIPQAIQGTSAIFVFVLAWFLGKYLPQYFKPSSIDPYQALGILLTIVGGAIVMLRR